MPGWRREKGREGEEQTTEEKNENESAEFILNNYEKLFY